MIRWEGPHLLSGTKKVGWVSPYRNSDGFGGSILGVPLIADPVDTIEQAKSIVEEAFTQWLKDSALTEKDPFERGESLVWTHGVTNLIDIAEYCCKHPFDESMSIVFATRHGILMEVSTSELSRGEATQ